MKRNSLLCLLVVVLTLLSLSPAVGARSPEYTMTELGHLGSGLYGYSFPASINNRGQVVGYSLADAGWHLFIWEDGEMSDLGVPASGTPDFVWPRAVNERGQVVGEFRTSEVVESAFLFDDGDWTVIRADDVYWSAAVDVTSRGQVLGFEFGQANGLRTFLWDDGEFNYLDISGIIYPQCMNERGQVLVHDHTGPMVRSFLWDGGVVVEVVSPSGGMVEALDINHRGQVVGRVSTSPAVGIRAFHWEDGVMTELPGLGGTWSDAIAVNSGGQIVGSSETEAGEVHVVLWDHGHLVDLGSHDGSHHGNQGCYARDINSRGQVVGYCWTDFGPRAYLWER